MYGQAKACDGRPKPAGGNPQQGMLIRTSYLRGPWTESRKMSKDLPGVAETEVGGTTESQTKRQEPVGELQGSRAWSELSLTPGQVGRFAWPWKPYEGG